ncbi:hypothetical protein NECAME_04696, partial [Necator americanus]
DISPFRCEECASVNLLWVRPYTTGKISSIRDLREFLVRTEVGLELNYSIKSWEEVQVAFYFDIIGFVFNFITEVNESQEEAKYACGAGKAIPSYLMRNVILKDRAHEYGVFMEYGQFIFYQNVQARVYKIQRPRNDPDEMYNKEIAYWTMSKGLTLLYNVFDVDVKTITEYRVATLIQPPFIQLSGNPKRPYEGYCIDLIELIRSEVRLLHAMQGCAFMLKTHEQVTCSGMPCTQTFERKYCSKSILGTCDSRGVGGVGVLVNTSMTKNIDSFEQLTTRIGRLRTRRCGPTPALTIFAAYAPTSSYEEEEALYVDL